MNKIICVIGLSGVFLVASEEQSVKILMDTIKILPRSISLYKDPSKDDLAAWDNAANLVGQFIQKKEPSLYSQCVKDQQKIVVLFTKLGDIYQQIIKPANESFGETYNYQQLEKMIIPLSHARRELSQGSAARFAFWKNKGAREVFISFKQALRDLYNNSIREAEYIIKTKGMIIKS